MPLKSHSLSVRAVKRLVETDALAGARFLADLTAEDAAKLLPHLPVPLTARCLEHMALPAAGERLRLIPAGAAAAILEALKPQSAADLFRAYPEDERGAMLETLSPDKRRQLQEFLQYPEDSAGRLMTHNYLAFTLGTPVRSVIKKLRATIKRGGGHTYTYVVDEGGVLKGVVNMRDLAVAESTDPIDKAMMPAAASVTGFTDREDVMQLVRGKNFLSVPVVDHEGRLLGAVKAGDLLEGAREEGAQDLQAIFGVSEDETPRTPWHGKVRARLPWLHVNLLTAFMAGAVVAVFEDLIARIAVLAVFLPIVAGQGGNAGAQTLAVILRGIVMREVKYSDARTVLLRETGVGLANGLVIGGVTALVAWLWKGNPYLGLVVAMAMVVNLAAAGLAGAAIPLALKKFDLDPAQSSSIFLTTVTDIVGFFAFLGFAMLFEPYLR